MLPPETTQTIFPPPARLRAPRRRRRRPRPRRRRGRARRAAGSRPRSPRATHERARRGACRERPHLREEAAAADAVHEARRVARSVDGLPRGERGRERRRGLDLAGEDRRARRALAHRGGDAAREPAAAVRDEDRVDVRQVLEDLEADRAVARDHGADPRRDGRRGRRARGRPVLDEHLPPALERERRRSRAPSRSIASSLRAGRWSGTTTVHGTPSRRAFHATPCAMLPALAV